MINRMTQVLLAVNRISHSRDCGWLSPVISPDGWTSLTDRADVVNQGVPLRVLLLTATGLGRYMSVIASVSPNSYQAELVDFFRNLDLHAPAAEQNREGPSSGPGIYESSAGSNRSNVRPARPPWPITFTRPHHPGVNSNRAIESCLRLPCTATENRASSPCSPGVRHHNR